MARGRLISKSLGSSRKFHAALQAGGKLGEFCQVLFPLIVANTDDFGRMSGDAFTIKNVVLPTSRRPEADFENALVVLDSVGLIDRYVAEGDIYLQIIDFEEHQPNLHKRTESRIPESPGISGKVRPNSTEFKRTESKRTEQKDSAHEREADRLFAQFWDAYPKKRAKEVAQRAWEKRRPNSELLTVILRALERQRLSPDWQKDSGRYIPLPATWLNQARWTDEVEVVESRERGAALLTNYGVWFEKYRQAKLTTDNTQIEAACQLCETWDDARLEKLAALVLTTDDPFIAGTDRAFRIFAMKASWADDRLRQWEKAKGVAV